MGIKIADNFKFNLEDKHLPHLLRTQLSQRARTVFARSVRLLVFSSYFCDVVVAP